MGPERCSDGPGLHIVHLVIALAPISRGMLWGWGVVERHVPLAFSDDYSAMAASHYKDESRLSGIVVSDDSDRSLFISGRFHLLVRASRLS